MILVAVIFILILTIFNVWISLIRRKKTDQHAASVTQEDPPPYFGPEQIQQGPYPGYQGYPPPGQESATPYEQASPFPDTNDMALPGKHYPEGITPGEPEPVLPEVTGGEGEQIMPIPGGVNDQMIPGEENSTSPQDEVN
jgi:hypothetical protein